MNLGAVWLAMPSRKPYPSDVSDEEWAFVVPYLTLLPLDAGPRDHDLRALLRVAAGRAPWPTAAVFDSQTLQSTPESGHRAGYDGATRKKGSKIHAAVDPLGHLLALHVTPATAQDRAQVEALAATVQAVTGVTVGVAYVDQGYTGAQPAADARAQGLRLEVVTHPETRWGFVLVP